MSQSNARFNALDTLVVTVHSVTMPVGYGKHAIKSKGRPLSVMAHLKRSIVDVKAEENCLAHALIIAIARVENDVNYTAYRKRQEDTSRSLSVTTADRYRSDWGWGDPRTYPFPRTFSRLRDSRVSRSQL